MQNQRSAAKSGRANRRKLQEALDALRLSEARYRDIVETQTELVSRYLPDTTVTFVNEAYCRFFGKTRDELVGSSLLNQIPESSHRVARDYIESLLANPRTEIIEHEVLLPDGSVGWQQWVDHVIVGPDGRVKELQGIGRDITDRKRAEELLKKKEEALRESYGRIADLAGRLLAAQETERARIGQELHDDLGQRLTALSWSIEAFVRRMPPKSTIRSELARLAAQSTDLCKDVVHLSHELRPVVLQQFGLSAALKVLCESTTIADGVAVDFTGPSDSPRAAQDIELSLYRVTQEALRNALIHSTADRVTIRLSESDNGLELKRQRPRVRFCRRVLRHDYRPGPGRDGGKDDKCRRDAPHRLHSGRRHHGDGTGTVAESWGGIALMRRLIECLQAQRSSIREIESRASPAAVLSIRKLTASGVKGPPQQYRGSFTSASHVVPNAYAQPAPGASSMQ